MFTGDEGSLNHHISGYAWGPCGNSPRFWRNINMWSFVVKQFFNGAAPSFEEALARKEDIVGHIAYINLKKKHESRPNSDHADIQMYVDRDWPFIQQQLHLTRPDVIFCGGTFRYIRSYLTASELSGGVYYWRNRPVIDFYHPSCRNGYRATFDALSSKLAPVFLRPTPPATS